MISPATNCFSASNEKTVINTTVKVAIIIMTTMMMTKKPARLARLPALLLTIALVGGCGGGTVWRSDVPGGQSDTSTAPGFPSNPDRRNGRITSTPITDGSSRANYDPNSPASLEPQIYLIRAEQSRSPLRESLILDAIGAMLDRDMTDDAIAQLSQLDASQLPRDLGLRQRIAMARIEAERVGPDNALINLRSIADSPDATPAIAAEALLALAQTQYTMNQPLDAANTLLRRSRVLARDRSFGIEQLERNSFAIWQYISEPDIVTLRRARNASTDAQSAAWFELAEIHKLYDTNPAQKNQAIVEWRQRNQNHPANTVIGYGRGYADTATEIGVGAYVEPTAEPPRQIALLLPMTSRFSKQAQAVHDGFVSMYERDGSPGRANFVLYDIGQDAALVSSFYQQAVSEGADFVVGPLGRSAAEALIDSNSIQVPTLLLGASDNLTGLSGAVYQFGLLPEAEARMLAQRAFADGHRSALILTPSSEFGARLKGALSQAWTQTGGTVLEETNYTPGEARDFGDVVKRLLNINDSEDRHERVRKLLGHGVEFQARRRQDVDVILLAARAKDARLLKPQINFYQGHDLPVYATSQVYSARPNALSDADLDGIIFPEMPWIVSTEPALNNLRQRLPRSAATANSPFARLFAFGMDAYGLVPVLDKLRSNPRARFGGVTALLAVNAQNSVTRAPVWTRFSNGNAVPIDAEENLTDNQQSAADN